MLDRLVVVTVPFVLSVRSEIRIYEKMLSGADLSAASISPLALHTAATFAEPPLASPTRAAGCRSLIRKLHLYDGRYGPYRAPGRRAPPQEVT